MKKGLVFWAAEALLIAVAACDSSTSPTRPLGRTQLKAVGLHVVASITRTGPDAITFRIGVENSAATTQTLDFSDGQFFDIEVADGGGEVVWRWSHDKYFTQAFWDLELDAGESYVRDTEWDLTGNDGQPLSPGSYTARFIITTSPRDEGLVLGLPLTI
jgi:hypothetical protein